MEAAAIDPQLDVKEEFRSFSEVPEKLASLNGYAVVNGCMAPEYCKQVIDYAESVGFERSSVLDTDGGSKRSEYRTSYSVALPPDEMGWVWDFANQTMKNINAAFNINCIGMAEAPVVIRYQDGQKYDWHIDMGNDRPDHNTRKISMILQLNDPSEFEGGGLEIFNKPEPEPINLGLGDLYFGPSFTLHRAAPVTKGTRYAMAMFLHGSRWQ